MDGMRSSKKIDIGRLISIPVFTFFMTLSTYFVYRDIKSLFPLTTIKPVVLINHLLLVCFYALIVLLYFLRSPAKLTNRSVVTNAIAILATFIPFILPIVGGSGLINPTVVIIADVIMMFGMAVSIYSLSVLGKSFSIIPQARKLVQNGPYRLIRHPLYLGELISLFGAIFAGLTFLKVVIFFLVVACQVYRAFQEEKLLAVIFPEYGEYCLKTARFVPGVF